MHENIVGSSLVHTYLPTAASASPFLCPDLCYPATNTKRLRRGRRGERVFRLWSAQLRTCECLCRHDAPVAVIMIIICVFSPWRRSRVGRSTSPACFATRINDTKKIKPEGRGHYVPLLWAAVMVCVLCVWCCVELCGSR